MAEILKEWLTERLQRPITWAPEEFVGMMRDGHVIANLLLSYHVINEDKFYLIRVSTAKQDTASSNWAYLTEWLHEIDINLTPADIKNILFGKSAYLLRLFYQLFLHLDRRDRTNFLKRERKMASGLVQKTDNRFKVDRVNSEESSFVDELSKPLLDDRRFVEWQKIKADKVKHLYEYMKYKYAQRIDNIADAKQMSQHSKMNRAVDKKDIEKLPIKLQNYDYDTLIELDQKGENLKNMPIDAEWVPNYMLKLYSKMHKKSDVEEFQKQKRNEVTNALWDATVEEEESLVDNELAKKVMKLSQFEKQMATQIMETKQQARNVIRNRILTDQEFCKQREQQFIQFLDNLKEQLQLEILEIDIERNRQNMLHKVLYEEKMRRKRKYYYEICYETMLAITDFAVKFAHYKNLLLGDEVPDHFIREWKALYFKQQPLFDYVEPLENILETDVQIEEEDEIEDINKLELDRQNVLNEYDFIEYHNYTGPWDLETIIPNYEALTDEMLYCNLGLCILGHIVYTLLPMKYPYPTKKNCTPLPEYKCKGILRGLPDKSLTVPLQTLLTLNRIHVTRLENVINFCLKQYKESMCGVTDIDISYDTFFNIAPENNKELIMAMKVAEESSSEHVFERVGGSAGKQLIDIPPNCKQTQTPKILPEDELKLSTPAELGKYAYEALFFGESLTDYLIASMIVEYLYHQKNISGFVLINYPNSYRETQILCEAFTGRAPPDEGDLNDSDDIFLEESIIKHRKKEKDEFKTVRYSRLVKNPHNELESQFETYFTTYINLMPTSNIAVEQPIWMLPRVKSELIDKFYSFMGINYSMYYENIITKDLLAQICWYLIGDLQIQPDAYDQLFGVNVYSNIDLPQLKREDSKIKSMRSDSGGRRISQKKERRVSKLSLVPESVPELKPEVPIAAPSLDSYVTTASPPKSLSEDINMLSIEKDSASQSEPVADALPGEELWEYAKMPIIESVGVTLASCWEQMENAYIDDLSQLFLAKRIVCNNLVPYVRYIHDKIEQIITLPSPKQDLVTTFQNQYNEFEIDWRDLQKVKNEWHCRVKELQQSLYKMCDERKVFAEMKTHDLTSDGWMMDELSSLVNVYTSCMQTELNRYVLSYQTMHDFYFSMLKRIPSSDRLSTKELPKINKEFDENASKKSEDKFKQLKSAYLQILLNKITVNSSNNPYNNVIESNAKTALNIIKELNDSYRSLISKEYSEIAKIVVPARTIVDGTGDSGEEVISPEESFKMAMLKCIEEWTMGVNGEMYRANLRIEALLQRCYRDMEMFTEVIQKAFNNAQQNINTYYMNEIKAVDWLCKYLQLAVDEGRKIPETLILEHDTFIIDPNLMQFAPPVERISRSEEPTENVTAFEFRASQLEKLRTQFKLCAPTGLALQQAFVYLLTDFLLFGKESCEGALFPDAWKKVDPSQVSTLVPLLYGDSIYIDWRDFLIYCLYLEYPTQDDLMEIRHNFRCKDPESTELIGREHFLEETFWFERIYDQNDPNDQYRLKLLKNFLFDLYETQADLMNYSAFLLAFCKNTDPFEGFVMALSMAVGKKVLYHMDDCNEIVTRKIMQKNYRDASHACAVRCAQEFYDNCVNNVMTICEGFMVTELAQNKEDLETSKKGGKKGKKGKDPESARDAKSSTPLGKKKASASAVDMHSTFICPPCEKPPKLPEEAAHAVAEEVVELVENPNAAYSVSQAVIWNVLQICLPWHFKLIPDERPTPYVDQIKDIFKVLEKDHDDGDIYICKFMIEPDVCKLLHRVKRFTALNLSVELRKVFEKHCDK